MARVVTDSRHYQASSQTEPFYIYHESWNIKEKEAFKGNRAYTFVDHAENVKLMHM